MQIRIGLELNENFDGRVLAWALDFPGCFAYGSDQPGAVVALAQALVAYEEWVNRRAGAEWVQLGDFDLRIVDTWQNYSIDDRYERASEGYVVDAWFLDDWRPLQPDEVERGLQLLQWSREELLNVARDICPEELDQERPGERWSIRGVLGQVANAEWWYLDRLGLAAGGRAALPEDVFERLAFSRRRLLEALPGLAGRELVFGKDGEFWSPRKLLRRSLWHEKDHLGHVLKLLIG